jgi:hypothetical protein
MTSPDPLQDLTALLEASASRCRELEAAILEAQKVIGQFIAVLASVQPYLEQMRDEEAEWQVQNRLLGTRHGDGNGV